MTPNSLKHIPNITDLTMLTCIGNGLRTIPAIEKETASTKIRIWNSVTYLAELGLMDVIDITPATKSDAINGRSRNEFVITPKGQIVLDNTIIDFQKNYLLQTKK